MANMVMVILMMMVMIGRRVKRLANRAPLTSSSEVIDFVELRDEESER